MSQLPEKANNLSQGTKNSPHLAKSLGPVMLWGLGVGYVISGMYFGWNLGLAEGGTLGRNLGFIGGMAQIIEFVFAPPAIAPAIGAYFHIFFPRYRLMKLP